MDPRIKVTTLASATWFARLGNDNGFAADSPVDKHRQVRPGLTHVDRCHGSSW